MVRRADLDDAMNLNSLISLPVIGFSFFILIVEILGYEVVFKKSGIGFRKSDALRDPIGIRAMLLSAIVYAGCLASTAGITLVEGLSWLRPGNAMAPLLGYIFGIPGCLGVGLGNMLADSFSGYYSVGSVGGFVGNFMLAYIPHKVLGDPPLADRREVLSYSLFVGLGSTFVSAYVIAGSLDVIWSAGFASAIPVIGGVAPAVQPLSEEALWDGLFRVIATNNLAMSFLAGVLIVVSFRYFSERGLFWRDRIGLLKSANTRRKFVAFLILGIVLSYVAYNVSVVLGIYGKIGRSENYVGNLLGILFFVVGLVGLLSLAVSSVEDRILSILIGSRSVDARALEVYLASRRTVLNRDSGDEATGERLGALLFLKVLRPELAGLLRRVRVQTFVDDYLKHIMLYMMNSVCSVKKAPNPKTRIICIEECVACKGISSDAPACGLIAGFSKGLTKTFLETSRGGPVQVSAFEKECKAMGRGLCKIELSWE